MLSRILSMARSSANRTPLPVLGLCCTVCDLARRPQAQPLLCIPDRLEIGNLRILLTVKSEDEWHLVQALWCKLQSGPNVGWLCCCEWQQWVKRQVQHSRVPTESISDARTCLS